MARASQIILQRESIDHRFYKLGKHCGLKQAINPGKFKRREGLSARMAGLQMQRVQLQWTEVVFAPGLCPRHQTEYGMCVCL